MNMLLSPWLYVVLLGGALVWLGVIFAAAWLAFRR